MLSLKVGQFLNDLRVLSQCYNCNKNSLTNVIFELLNQFIILDLIMDTLVVVARREK